MSNNRVNETGTFKSIGANGNYVVPWGGILVGFICNTAGSIGITDSSGATLLAATAVTVGQFLPLASELPTGGTVTLSGGCVGSLVVA